MKSISFGKRLTEVRKDEKMSQAEVGKIVGVQGVVIGKYERNENSPSLEMALKITKAFGVTVDFLLGEGEHSSYDQDTIDRTNSIQKMDTNTKAVLFNIIDNYIQNFKTKQAFATK